MSNKMIYINKCGGDNSNMYELDANIISLDKSTITLKFFEGDEGWTSLVRGKVAATMKDDGNGVTFKFRDKKKKVRLDYSELQEMLMLIKYNNEDSGKYGFDHSITKLKPCECDCCEDC